MNNDIHELNFSELKTVSGGMRNLANDPGFHPNIKTPDNTPGGSPLFGNGSYHDTIDLNDNLP